MYSLATRSEIEPHELEDEAPTLLPVGVELRPDEMRPSIWEYEKGEENAYHRQREQEELYVVLEGTVDVTIEREDDRDVVELRQHDCLVVPPESWRQLRAVEDSTVLVVGSPNVKDDGILEG
ncbi:cupin domain-containing protein [Natrononativus amylolyticus]|uniref:cupin domain-containing protein n=1 Tax=Natrononativus amylolyticus TaxID=2963434 RepID=UPI0020CCE704|nr:cupin domain-containing protein [Natrononativus amylolyticus]